jgi:hypothetical protein
MAAAAIGVMTQPGQTQLTRPRDASRTISFFKLRVMPYAIAAFAAE